MSTKFFLDERDIETLTKLIVRSQQARSREALCLRIGIEPSRIGFIKDPSDNDFFIQLIHYLNQINDKEALCKLCCQELFPIFNTSTDRTILEEIAVKLNCPQENIPIKPVIPIKPALFFQKKGFFLASSTIFVIILTVIGYNHFNKNTFNCEYDIINTSQEQSSNQKIQINLPQNNACVEELQKIEGEVTVKEARQVLIVVKPLIDSTYYVQPLADINNGKFKTQIYLGDKDTAAGTEFEIRGFILTQEEIDKYKESTQLDNWPKVEGEWSSERIFVKKK